MIMPAENCNPICLIHNAWEGIVHSECSPCLSDSIMAMMHTEVLVIDLPDVNIQSNLIIMNSES